MTEYIKIKLNISDNQKDKIRQAISGNNAVTIQLSHEDLVGEHILALTKQQVNKISNAYENNKGTRIKLSKAQLKYNKQIEGGFIEHY